MALKDWKKDEQDQFNKTAVQWSRKDGRDSIIVSFFPKGGFFKTDKYVFAQPQMKNLKTFKTKSQALKFARNYRKTH